jgi:hypothetical protein
MDQGRAPVLDALGEYHRLGRYGFTPPGHRQGRCRPERLRCYEELSVLRRELPDDPEQVSADEAGRMLRFGRAHVELMADVSEREQEGVQPCCVVVRR